MTTPTGPTGSTDPLLALRAPSTPVDPDPGFAAALRARIERALLAPEGEIMTTSTAPATTAPTTTAPTTTAPTTTAPTTTEGAAAALRLHTLTPYLAVADAEREVDFYVRAFGAVRRDDPIRMPDGRIGHVEVALGDSVLMLADEYPELGLLAPSTRGGVSQSLHLEVADPDAVVAAAVVAGATLERAVADSPHGRGGSVLDPSGHRWMVSAAPGSGSGPRAGDLGYMSLWTADSAAADRFWSTVLGWTTRPHAGGFVAVGGLAVHAGIAGGRESTLFCCWAVPDADDAVALVRAAGGTAEEPTDEPYGRVAQCVDDQGLPFAVFTPPGGVGSGTGSRPEPGDLSYYELRVPDPTRAIAFFSTVLGWRFRPGTDPGYWHQHAADGSWPVPSGGLVRSGQSADQGAGRALVVPWFRVADAVAAVAAVRAAGGTAAEPTAGREGLVAECTDDQGGRFCLVQP